jgi:four helix bundle protein
MIDLKDRAEKFALAIIELVEHLPKNNAGYTINRQLIRCATSIGANDRASNRARSDNEIIAKMNIVLEESDESCYRLKLIVEKDWMPKAISEQILKEANELTAIFVTTLKKMSSKNLSKNSNQKSLHLISNF